MYQKIKPTVKNLRSASIIPSLTQLFIISLLLQLFTPALASADCLSKVKALYANEFNAYNWPPYKSTRIHLDAWGKKKTGFDNIVETPLRTISHVHGSQAVFAIDQKLWLGPTSSGPWKKAPNNFPKDRRETHKKMHAASLKNLKDAECVGEVELDGKKLQLYRYTTKTNPDKSQRNMWFGGTDEIHYDPKTSLVMKRVQTNFINSFSKNISKDTITEVFTYDKSIKLTEPE